MKDSMRGFPMPEQHKEKKMKNVPGNDLKYSGQFSNPEDLERSAEQLSSYVRKNKMKY